LVGLLLVAEARQVAKACHVLLLLWLLCARVGVLLVGRALGGLRFGLLLLVIHCVLAAVLLLLAIVDAGGWWCEFVPSVLDELGLHLLRAMGKLLGALL